MAANTDWSQQQAHEDLLALGWREWIALPQLGIDLLKAKIDTGARTSSLHAMNLHSFRRDGEPWARFDVQPLQQRSGPSVRCEAPVVDHREIKNANGQFEQRVVIRTPVVVGGREWPVEITLTNRSDKRFRMLLGRTALRGQALVNPNESYLLGKKAT